MEKIAFGSPRNQHNHKTRLLCFIFLVLTPAASASSSCCSVCDCKPHEVWCEYRELTSVPVDIPTNTRRLYMFNNNISSIPVGVFAGLKKLELIDLSSNHLSSDVIKPGVFNGLEHLQDIILSSNKLTRIQENTFSDIPSLVRLYLEDNEIEDIDESAFANLHKLVELKLSSNKLTDFPKITNSAKLRRLYLSRNRLVRLHANTLADVNLEQLTLSSNLLNQLPSTVFRDVSNMRQLDLSGNLISRMPRIISSMNSLHTLNLSGNSIASLPDMFLSNLRRMKVLDLGGMRLITLPRDFIPRRVYLNVFDVSNNPWTCDCAIMWLIKYMKIVGGVFIGMKEVRCNAPSKLRDRQLASLSEDELNCDSEVKLTPSLASVNVCEGLACDNGAQCYINEATKKPACRCLAGWTGLLCNKNDNSASTPSKTDQAELLIQTNSITSHSVKIRFPRTERLITIETTELETLTSETSSITIFPNTYAYTVHNLKPGTRYRICVTAGNQGVDTKTDKLCNNVKTKTIFLENHENSFGNTEQDSDFTTGRSENRYNKANNELKMTAENLNSSLFLPLLGVGLGICLVLAIVAFFVCYRKRKSRDRDLMKKLAEIKNEKLAAEEVVPMIKDQRYIPTSYSCDSSTMTQTTDDLYQLPLHQQPQRSCAVHQLRPAPRDSMNETINSRYESQTPNSTLSSDPNNMKTHGFDYARRNMYSPQNWGSLNQGEWSKMNNSRQECYPEPHSSGIYSDAPSEGTIKKIYRATPTQAIYLQKNEIYGSPNAPYGGPGLTCGHQLHNSLKVRSKNRDLATPPATYSLRSEHRASHRNNYLENQPNILHRIATKATYNGPIHNEKRTVVI